MSVKVSYRKDRERWQVEYHVSGERKRPLFRERTEADNHARKILLGLKPEDRECISVFDAGQKYFHSESVRKSPKSRANDKRYINLMFHFMTYERGIERLNSIQLDDMEAFREWLIRLEEFHGKPVKMAPATVNRCLRVMGAFFVKHIKWKSISENPCQYLDLLDAEDNSRAPMSGDQYLATLGAAPDWMKVPLQFMYLSGAPAICVQRLTWEDVDFKTKNYTVWRKKGAKARIKRVSLAMTSEVFALLIMIRNQWPAVEGAVFRDSEGRPLLADRVTREGNDAIRAAGVRGVSLYGLRHALATDLTAANVATEIVRQAMGHQSIATTQRYTSKVGLKSIAGAIESVRGGSLVATSENEQRQQGAGFGS